jgi:hypothetical protein
MLLSEYVECWNIDITCEKVRRSVTKGLGPSAPQLHCREATVLSVEWECSGKPVFVVEFRSEDNEWSPLDKVRWLVTQVLAMCC